jgi:hypothetical protein
MSSPNQQQHMCNICGGVFKNDASLAQHFVLSRMCLTEGKMRRQQTNQKKKRRSFGPGTPAERKANKREAEQRVAVEATINYDTPLDFRPLGFDDEEGDDDDAMPFLDHDEESDFSDISPPDQPIHDTLLRSELCALSHFSDVPQDVEDQDIELLHDLGLLDYSSNSEAYTDNDDMESRHC